MSSEAVSGSLVILNSNTQTRNIHITAMIVESAREMLGAARVRIATYDDVVSTCRALERPLLLVIDGQRLNGAVVRAAAGLCRATALWLFDDPYNLRENMDNARLFDHVFTNEPSAVEAYEDGAHFLPLAGTIHPEEVPDEVDKEFDVFFCGSAWPNRVAQLNRLLRASPGLDWRICLTYNLHLPPFPLELPESAYLRSLAFDDMLEMAARSRVTLDLNRAFGGTDTRAQSISATHPGPRIFELAGRGAFQLSLNTPGLREAFGEDEIPLCHDIADMSRTLDRWLEDAEGRREAAVRARRKVAEGHTYAHRLRQILETCRPDRARPGVAATLAELPRRPKLLFVVHNVRGDNAFGGLELHQEIVARHLAASYDILFLWAYPAEGGHALALLDENYSVLETRATPVPDTSLLLQHPSFETFFSEVLQRQAIDLVHIFHFREMPPSLGAVARALGVPYTVSLHDYYAIFRNFVLADERGEYLGDRIGRLNEMERLTANTWAVAPGAYARRHAAYARVLRDAESVIHISHASRRVFETAFPALRRHPSVRVVHAPLPSDNYRVFRSIAQPRGPGGRPRFVVLGNMAAHKGGPYLVEALRMLPDFEGELHFHGSRNEQIEEQILAIVGDRASFHGRYAPGSLDLTGYDFSLHLSTWPETYCQTLSEAWAMGVVPIVTDLGAPGERVTHMVNGLKVDPRYPSTLAALLDHISKSPESFEALREAETEGLFMDPATAAAQYAEIFAGVLEGRAESGRRIAPAATPHGVTVHTLGHAARRDLWTMTGATPPEEPVRPAAPPAPAWTDLPAARLIPLEGLEGSIDRIDLAPSAELRAVPEDSEALKSGATIHVDDVLNVRGWLNPATLPDDVPGQRQARPVVAIQAQGADLWAVFPAEPEPRTDLEDSLGAEARDWGLVAVAHIANSRQEMNGPLVLRLGLMTPGGQVRSLSSVRTLTGHMSKRPKGR